RSTKKDRAALQHGWSPLHVSDRGRRYAIWPGYAARVGPRPWTTVEGALAYARPRMHRGLALALALAACEAGDTLAIDLELEAPQCEASSFEQVSFIEIAVYGEHDGQLCVLAEHCLWQVDAHGLLENVDDFVAAMKDGHQPLVSGLLEGAQHI